MTDYRDLILRYVDGEQVGRLLFDDGRRALTFPVGVELMAQPVTTASELTAALRKPDRPYLVKAGIYVGNFVAPEPGSRIACEPGALFAPGDASKPNFQINAGDFSMLGGDVKCGLNDAIIVGSPTATTVDVQPHRVVFDGLTVTAPVTGAHRGFALHGVDVTVRRSRVEGFYRAGQECQAIWIHNGPGPYGVLDNFLEGAGENILVGGSKFAIPGVVPSDITITGNTIAKRPEWRALAGAYKVKNSVEMKNARRVLIANNVIDGCWVGGQSGSPIVLTVRNTAKAEGNGDNPWVIVDEITVRNNIVRNCPDYYAVNILGRDDGGRTSEQTKTITIEGNLFQDSPGGVQVGNGVVENLTIRRNTFPAIRMVLLMFTNFSTKTKLNLLENVGKTGPYCVFTDGSGAAAAVGNLSAACGADGYVCTGNVLERSVYTGSSDGKPHTAAFTFPAGNAIVAPGMLGLDANYVLPGGAAGWSGPAVTSAKGRGE